MKNEEIENYYSRLVELENKYKVEISSIYNYEILHNKGISHVAHYMASIANRAISLLDGFKTLLDKNNYSTAISLIRLQIDNCLRLYAISICNPVYLLEEVIKENHIRRLKDRDGKKMTDVYLIEKIEEVMPNFKQLYDETSGYIHFSFQHLKTNNRFSEIDGEQFVETYVGREIEITELEKIKYLDYMYQASFNLYRLIYSYRYDSQNEE